MPLSDAGGKTAVIGFESNTYLALDNSRAIVSGQLVAIPEPSKMLLVALGVASLAVLRLGACSRGANGRAPCAS